MAKHARNSEISADESTRPNYVRFKAEQQAQHAADIDEFSGLDLPAQIEDESDPGSEGFKDFFEDDEYYRPRWSDRHPIISFILKVLFILIILLILACVGVCAYWLQDPPDCSNIEEFNTATTTEVYANDKTTLLAQFQLEYREPLDSLDQITDYLEQGTIAVEDERFYSHPGIDPTSIVRAVINNMTGGSLSGASTITQQLARNTILADEMTDMTLERKVREAYVALKLEELYSKDEILLLYLNVINYGQGAYGIEAASQRYFSKSASELTLAEAALLAGIPQSPVYNNPVDFPDHALARRNVVLDRMAECGYITEEQAAEAKAEDLNLNTSWASTDGIEAYPYFASYVRQELYNSYNLSTADIFQGGMTIYTTLDPEIQEYAEEAVAEKEEQANKSVSTSGYYENGVWVSGNQTDNSLEVALVAVEPGTGYIKAMVGGDDYYEDQYNLVTQGARQAGSAFKTFTLITALEQGISPETQVNCSSSVTIGDWKVANIYYTNYGTRSIARAFAVSSNTGFARLISAVGPSSVAETAHSMGITSELEESGALTLGVSEVTPLEMASAYATIASEGVYYEPVCIEVAYDNKGNTVIDNTNPTGTQVISKEVAAAAIKVMRTVVESYEGTGTSARLTSGQVVAGKTGTSENYKDSWFCGITPQMSVALWMGDRTNTLSIPSSVSVCSAFATFMNAYMKDRQIEPFFTADALTYTKTFTNTDLDVEIASSWSYSDDDEEDSDSTKASDKKDTTNASSSASEGTTGDADKDSSSASDSGDTSSDEQADSGSEGSEQGGSGGSDSGTDSGDSSGSAGTPSESNSSSAETGNSENAATPAAA